MENIEVFRQHRSSSPLYQSSQAVSPSIGKVANSSNFFHTSNSGLATYNSIYKLRKVKQVFKKEAMDVAAHDRKSRPKHGRNSHTIRNP
jgi:hypothetical protein